MVVQDHTEQGGTPDVSRINVVIAVTKTGLQALAEGIAENVTRRDEMTLVGGQQVSVGQADALLQSIPASPHCAVVIVGPPSEADPLAQRWLSERSDIVVMLLDSDRIVRVTVHNPGLPALLD